MKNMSESAKSGRKGTEIKFSELENLSLSIIITANGESEYEIKWKSFVIVVLIYMARTHI